MSRAFHILGSAAPRPESSATIFCDGSADESFRRGTDLELSHWNPNRTPRAYRADTSTEICMRFVADGDAVDGYDLVVNNHADVDGLLSVLTLVAPQFAREHVDTIVAAAEMGDFWCHGDEAAQNLFQGLTLLQDRIEAAGGDTRDLYSRAFLRARELLDGADDEELAAGRSALAASVDLIDSGRVGREVAHDRFVAYTIPRELTDRDPAAALRVPAFNEALSVETLLLPHARNRLDKERVQLVSVDTADGWRHDLWYPGYMWADTEDVWRAPGLFFADSTNAWFYGHDPLTAAVAELQSQETGAGTWTIAERLLPFRTLPGRNFPVVLTVLGADDQPCTSSLDAATVARHLAPAFQET